MTSSWPGATARRCGCATSAERSTGQKTVSWAPGRTASSGILLVVFKQPGANVIDTVERIKAALPHLEASIPPSIHVNVMMDRTLTIRASVEDVQFTLILSVVLVVMVIFLFLRSVWATIIPSVTVPVALICTFAAMYLLGYSLDNLSLMALTIAVGFVVDDAIVMLENIYRHIEDGMDADGGRAERGRRDRLHHPLDQLLAGRGVHSAAADGRHRRPSVPRVRDDDHHRGVALGVGLADADADDVLAVPAASSRGAQLGVSAGRGLLRCHDRRLSPHAGHCVELQFITLMVFLATVRDDRRICISSFPRASSRRRTPA